MSQKEYRYSPKVLFREGDKMRVSGGPYYQTKEGQKIKMGVSGMYFFSHVDEQGNVWVQDKGGQQLVYMGEPYISDKTGTHMEPHKLRKVRKG